MTPSVLARSRLVHDVMVQTKGAHALPTGGMLLGRTLIANRSDAENSGRGANMLPDQVSQLLDGTGDAAFAVDERGDFCAWNRAAEQLLGYSSSVVLGKPCAPIIEGRSSLGKNICQERCGIIDCALRGQEISSFEMEIRTNTSRRIWARISVLVFRNDRTNHHLIAHIIHDITTAKRIGDLNTKLLRIAQEIATLPDGSEPLPPALPLTRKEKDVLQLVAQGRSSAAVASDLGITEATLRNHLNHINEKLQTHNRVEAIFQAKRRGII